MPVALLSSHLAPTARVSPLSLRVTRIAKPIAKLKVAVGIAGLDIGLLTPGCAAADKDVNSAGIVGNVLRFLLIIALVTIDPGGGAVLARSAYGPGCRRRR